MSEEEEAKRRSAVDDSNASALFDDQNQLESPNTNPFPFIDPTPYATGLQPQFTQVQPQFTSFNPYQQQAQQEAMQAEYLRQQQEWMRQQQEIQAAQAQAQAQAQQEEWMRQQQMLQMQQQQQQQMQPQPIPVQPTGFGSNNPFAPTIAAPPLPSFSPQHSNGLPAPQSSTPSFNLQGTYANSSAPTFSPSSPSPAPSSSTTPSIGRAPTRADQDHSQLASLFENREGGQDTFGNVGMLRYFYVLFVLFFFWLMCSSRLGMATQMPGVSSLRRLVYQVTTLSPSSNSNSRTTTSRSLVFEECMVYTL
jgi:epsin